MKRRRTADFARLWTGTTASGIATWSMPFVLGLALVDGSLVATDLGAMLAARTVGFIAVMPAAGVVADRMGGRSTVRWSATIAAVASAALAATLMAENLSVGLLAAVVVGAGQGACRPAFQSLVPAVVPVEERQRANAAISIAVRVSVLAGPAATGAASLVLSPAGLLLAIAALWLLAGWVTPAGRHRRTLAAEQERHSLRRDFAEGLSEARRHPWFLVGLGALATVITTGYSVTAVAVPLVARDASGGTALVASVATAYTAGALAGALLVTRWQPASEGWAALAGLATYSVAPLALALEAPAVVVIAAYAACGVGIEIFNVPWFTATQREVDPAKLSRVSSLDFLVSYGLAPVGLALIAPAISLVGLRPVLAACAAACLIAPVAAAAVPSSRHFSRDRVA